MKVLIITNLFPSKKEPNKAVFNKQQFLELSKLCELKVVAPVPFFAYSKALVPAVEIVEGVEVYHPRYLVIPKTLRCIHGLTYFFGILGLVKRLHWEFKFETILASWAYPDIYAASGIAKKLKIPFFAKVHGSDVNLAYRFFLRPQMIAKGLKRAVKIISVSAALTEKMVNLGIDQNKIELLPNGVDAKKFHLMDRVACRKELGLPLDKKVVLYVGNMVPVKGTDIFVEAFGKLNEDFCVVMIGDGELRPQLESKVKQGVYKADILFIGRKPHDEIPKWMNAADVFCLPSRNEGCPNVVLEALACGCPVVATRVGGAPEILHSEELGIVVEPKNASALYKGICDAFDRKWDKTILCKKVEGYSWEDNALKLMKLLKEAMNIKGGQHG